MELSALRNALFARVKANARKFASLPDDERRRILVAVANAAPPRVPARADAKPSWEVSTDPERWPEAIEWFSQRTVVTRDEALRMDLDTRQRAFWVGGSLQLSQIQRVFDKLQTALENGEPFEDFKKRVRSELTDPVHVETVMRNGIQRAYNAGRWRQMKDPAIVRFRPFFMFDAIGDSRTTPTCTKRDGTVLPHDHPFWSTSWPPLHHRCRSSARSLRRSQAEERGITTVPPVTPATPGWGNSPDKEPVWKPDPSKHDPALLRELERKSTVEPPAPAKKSKPEHDPKFWEKHYEAEYGDAAPAVAWGRAMRERGLDRSVAEVHAELKRLLGAKHPGVSADDVAALAKLPQNRRIGDTLTGRMMSPLVALSEHTRTIKKTYPLHFTGQTKLGALTGARNFYQTMADVSVQIPSIEVKFDPGERAFANRGQITLGESMNIGTAIHEIAHVIEFEDPRALNRSLAFLRARTRGEALRKLRDVYPDLAYKDNEVTRPDEFFDAYVGKDYGNGATEVTSMGYEYMLSGHKDAAQALEKDPDLLLFLLGQLAGK